MELLKFENDVQLIIQSQGDKDEPSPKSFVYLTNKTILGLYSEFFEKLWLYANKKESQSACAMSSKLANMNAGESDLERFEVTIDFPESIIKSCLDAIKLVATQNIFPFLYQSMASCFLKNTLIDMFTDDFILKIECLQYIQINTLFLNYILRLDIKSFDIDQFLELDCIPGEKKWGHWSIMGTEKNKPKNEICPQSLPVSIKMEKFEDYHVIKIPTKFDFGEDFKGKTFETFNTFNSKEFGLWVEFENSIKSAKFDIKLIHCHSDNYPQCVYEKLNLGPFDDKRKYGTIFEGFSDIESEGEYIFLVKKFDD